MLVECSTELEVRNFILHLSCSAADLTSDRGCFLFEEVPVAARTEAAVELDDRFRLAGVFRGSSFQSASELLASNSKRGIFLSFVRMFCIFASLVGVL